MVEDWTVWLVLVRVHAGGQAGRSYAAVVVVIDVAG